MKNISNLTFLTIFSLSIGLTLGARIADAKQPSAKKATPNASPIVKAPTVQCTLTPGRKLELSGFYLGMTVDEFRNRVNKLQAAVHIPEPDAVGVRAGGGNVRLEDESPRGMDFEFTDEKLTALTIAYPDNMVKWNGEEDFYNRIAQGLGISNKWNVGDRDKGVRSVKCGNYEISGQYLSKIYNYGTNVQAKIVDLNARQTAKARAAENEAKSRANFRP
jgi:hypothetical protein